MGVSKVFTTSFHRRERQFDAIFCRTRVNGCLNISIRCETDLQCLSRSSEATRTPKVGMGRSESYSDVSVVGLLDVASSAEEEERPSDRHSNE